ncbi:hypothetical protein JCM6882_006794 [Rhodosporidiobolus microsporus]
MAQANRHESAVVTGEKVSIVPGSASEDGSQATYCILEEDHTLGNLLRWMLMKNPSVEFCGYSAPHPSEAKIHLRIQMYDGKQAREAFAEALDNIEAMAGVVLNKYNDSLAKGDYDRVEDEQYDFDTVNKRLWEAKEAAGKGSYDDFLREKQEKEDKEAVEAGKAKGKGKAVKAAR